MTFLVQGFQRQQQLIQEEENAKSLSLQKKKKKKARETRKKIEAIEAAERAQFETLRLEKEMQRCASIALRLEKEMADKAEAARLESEKAEALESEKAEAERMAEAARVVDGRIVVPHLDSSSSVLAEKESSIGGMSTCIVCFTHDKTHLAFPCGHQCVCEECSKAMHRCPYCREDVVGWTQVRMA